MSSEFFFRNDDVRDKLDESLIEIQDIFIEGNVPITHAVEPANVVKDVIEWLIYQKKEYPNLIALMQHGYDHTIKNNFKKGEFEGQRGFHEQFDDIFNGKKMMN